MGFLPQRSERFQLQICFSSNQLICIVMSPDKIGTLVRQMIGMGSTDFVIGFMDKIDMIIDGGHLM